jgi:hypothetical protein
MKLLFSESAPDYSRYLYPYVVWAVPEPGETAADLFAAGFLPTSPDLDCFGLCRHLRLPLRNFRESSENRRILRKGEGIAGGLIPRAEFAYTAERRRKWLDCANARFDPGAMPEARLDRLMDSRLITHVLAFRDEATEREVGTVLLFLEPPRVAFYHFAFYDLDYLRRNVGMYMMTWAARKFAQDGFHHIYLGTCYSGRALYKTQFIGVEMFNGFRWSSNVEELRLLLRRNHAEHHLLRDPEFLAGRGDARALARESSFQCRLPNG